jgi:hypothetical protein
MVRCTAAVALRLLLLVAPSVDSVWRQVGSVGVVTSSAAALPPSSSPADAAAEAAGGTSVCKCECCKQLGACAVAENMTIAVESCDKCTKDFCSKQSFCADFQAFVKSSCIDRDAAGDKVFLISLMTLSVILVAVSFCKARVFMLVRGWIAALRARLPRNAAASDRMRQRRSSVTRSLVEDGEQPWA